LAIVFSVLLSFSFGHCIICPSVFFFWPWHYLSFCLFLLAIVLSVLPSFYFGHCIICPSVFFFWPFYYLSFCLFILTIVLSVLLSFSFGHCIICPSFFFFWPLYYLSFCLFIFAIVLSLLIRVTAQLTPSISSNFSFTIQNPRVEPRELESYSFLNNDVHGEITIHKVNQPYKGT
jgi:hypothetical protein